MLSDCRSYPAVGGRGPDLADSPHLPSDDLKPPPTRYILARRRGPQSPAERSSTRPTHPVLGAGVRVVDRVECQRRT